MTAPSKDFSGLTFDLALGEIYGLRVWVVDEYGRLRARHIEGVPPWRPGVNVAACHAAKYDVYGGIATLSASMFRAGGLVFGPSDPPKPQPEKEHAAPDESCRCGFYAYTCPGPETYADAPEAVLGVIRGTGRTLIGAKGFRCEKAEIVALLDPNGQLDRDTWAGWRRDRLRAAYPEVPLLGSRDELLQFAPIESTAPEPTSDAFWELP